MIYYCNVSRVSLVQVQPKPIPILMVNFMVDKMTNQLIEHCGVLLTKEQFEAWKKSQQGYQDAFKNRQPKQIIDLASDKEYQNHIDSLPLIPWKGKAEQPI